MEKVKFILLFSLATSIIALLVVAFLPSKLLTLRIEGEDKYEYHRKYAGKTTMSQSFTVPESSLAGVGVLVVDMKGSAKPAPVEFIIKNEKSGEILRQGSVSGDEILDDSYLYLSFKPLRNVKDKKLLLTLSAPSVDPKAPYAVRITSGDNYADGARYENDKIRPESDIAFELYRSAPFYQIMYRWTLQRQHQLLILFEILASGLIGALLLTWMLGNTRRALLVTIIVIIFAGLIVRINLSRFFSAEAGYDAYQYLTMAKGIVHSRNIFQDDPMHLPGYPLLLTPALAISNITDLQWGRIVNMVAFIGIILLLFPLARTLNFQPIVPVTTAVLLMFNKDFLFTSLRPLPYTLYTLLLLANLVVFFKAKTLKNAIWWGVLLGAMGMVRQEAFVPIAILVAAYTIRLWYQKTPVADIAKYLVTVCAPVIIILSPFFINNYLRAGNPIASPYLQDRSDLSYPHSVKQFWEENVPRLWGVMGSTWTHPRDHETQFRWTGFFRVVVILLSAFYLAYRFLPKRYRLATPLLEQLLILALIITSLFLIYKAFQWSWTGGGGWLIQLNTIAFVAMLLGIIELVRSGKWTGLLVTLVLFSQILIPTVIHPYAKHYQQSWPLLAMGLAAVILPIFGIVTDRDKQTERTTLKNLASAAPLAFALSLMFVPVLNKIGLDVDRQNYLGATKSVTLRAVESLEHVAGNVAAESTETELAELKFYLDSRLRLVSDNLSPDDQWQWLQENNISYVVDTNKTSGFTLQDEPDFASKLTLVKRYETVGRNDEFYESRVFAVNQ